MSDQPGFVSSETYGTPGVQLENLPPQSGAFEGQDWFGLSRQIGRVLEEGRLTAGAMGLPTEEGIALAPQEPTEPMVQPDALNKDYEIPGHLNFTSPLPASVAQMMNTAKHEELARQDAAARTPPGFFAGAERMGAGFVTGMLDPINLAASVMPIVGEARIGGMLARAGLEGLPLALGARAGAGAVSGGLAQLPLVGLQYGLSRAEGADYGMADAAADVLMGAAGGAFLHPLLGLGRPFETPELRAAIDNPAINEATARAAVAAVMDQRSVDVADYASLQNAQAVRMAQIAELRRTADAMRAEAIGIPSEVQDPATEARRTAIEEELTGAGAVPAERRAALGAELRLLTEGGAPLSDLERSRNWAQFQGLQIAAERNERRIQELQDSLRGSQTVRQALGESPPDDAARIAMEAARVRLQPTPKPGEPELRPSPDPVQMAALEQWVEQVRPPVAEARAPVPTPAGQLRLDSAWMKAASTTNEKGELDAKAATGAVTNEVSAALARGDKVVLNIEGKQIPIVAVRDGMMRDAEGKPWGSGPILFDQSGQRTFVEIHPAAAAAPEHGVTQRAAPAHGETSGFRVPGRAVPKEPTRLVAFLRKAGGVQDEGGDITAMLGGPRHLSGLVSTKGLPLDEAARRAWEAGYFPELGETRPSINDLRNAIEDDLRGTARHSHYDEAAVAEREGIIAHNAEIQRIADAHNINPAGLTRTQFANRIAEAMSKDEMAREQASFDKSREADVEELAAGAREFVESRGDHWNPDEFYGKKGPRTLEELENEHRQADAARSVVQGAPGNERPAAPAGSPGPGEEGGGHGRRPIAPAGSGEAERQPAAVSAAVNRPAGGAAGRTEGRGAGTEAARPAGLKPQVAAMLLPEERAEFEQIEQAHANVQGDAQAYAAAAGCIAEGQA